MNELEMRRNVKELNVNGTFEITEVEDDSDYEKNIREFDSDKTTGKFEKVAEFHTASVSLHNLPETLRKIVKTYQIKRNKTIYSVRLKDERGNQYELFFNEKTETPPLILSRDDMRVGAYVKHITV